MKRNYLIIYLAFLVSLTNYAQSIDAVDNTRFVCRMPDTGEANNTFIGLRDIAKARMANESTPCTNIVVNYNGFPSGIPSGFGPEQIAFQIAVDIWATLIESDQTIYIDANWVDTGNPNNLGSAGPTYFASIPGSTDNILYPAALFEKLTNTTNSSNDISCSFNSARTDWFFPQVIDADAPANTFNFTTVVLHELGHGLGMLGFGGTRGGIFGLQGFIRGDANGNTTIDANDPNAVFSSTWDTFIEVGGNSILDETTFPDPSTSMLDAFISTASNMDCISPLATQENNGVPPITQGEIFNNLTQQFEFRTGSSYSHWDENTFNRTETALMTPFLGPGEDVYDPGNVTLGFMEDMGWSLCQGSLSNDEFDFSSVTISPNPFTNTITLNLPASLSNDTFNVSLIDINGRVILNQTPQNINGELTISDLSNLEASLYFLTIESTTSNISITKKIVKN